MSDDRSSPIDEAHARELLARERERIELALAEQKRAEEQRDDLDPHTQDDTERMHEGELDAGIVERERTRLEAIERAERRLDEGTYGLSVESGEPIPAGRLEAIPWAERTGEEQEHYERTH